MADLEEMKKILGIWIERDRRQGTLKIFQGPYIDVVLKRFNMMEANPVSMPLSKTMKLVVPIGSNNTPTVDVPYAKAIGSLMYAALGT